MKTLLSKTVPYIRQIIGPMALLALCPPLIFLVWYTNVFVEGSVTKLVSLMVQQKKAPSLIFANYQTEWGEE